MSRTYEHGYKQGCIDVLRAAGKWLDEDTIAYLEEKFGIAEEDYA